MSARIPQEKLIVRGHHFGVRVQIQLQRLVRRQQVLVKISHRHHLSFHLHRDYRRHILRRVDHGRRQISIVKDRYRQSFIQGLISHHISTRIDEKIRDDAVFILHGNHLGTPAISVSIDGHSLHLGDRTAHRDVYGSSVV